ncbi:MAG: transposase [Fibrobacteres bacterium]|nr:transposase [Fibrobacterota bacterium]
MTALEDRRKIALAIDQAHLDGCRLKSACSCAGIDVRTLQRWKQLDGEIRPDRRPGSIHPRPSHALSEAEREKILQVVNEPRFAELSPSQIVPKLADEGAYLASESTFHRVLRKEGQHRHRGRAKAARTGRVATTHIADRPGQVWCWDVTWLPCRVVGRWFYLYMILDLCSRKIVGYVVHESESSDHAAALVRRTAVSERIDEATTKPVLHGDNGAALKATTVLKMLKWLGIAASYSRLRVSNDNAFAESVFRTLKYHTSYPLRGFEDLA